MTFTIEYLTSKRERKCEEGGNNLTDRLKTFQGRKLHRL
jgi:hypothetical protein